MSVTHSSIRSGKPLRFASLPRVSGERQEKEGESLRTQRAANDRDVATLGGTVVAVYGGQEHATPGFEKAEVDRLIADASKGIFDAVIIAYADRWSRDNAKSKEGLAVFRRTGVRFFVGTSEMDLFDPNCNLILGMHAEIGEFIAMQQTKKSLENRIARARRGIPTVGELPYGRTWSKEDGWGVDEAKRAKVVDIAARYLAGESLADLARLHGLSHSRALATLRDRCGEAWRIEFDDPRLNIRETVPVAVPRLLDDATIKAVRERITANRTYRHRPPAGEQKYAYLLGGFIFCGGCGYTLYGQPNRNGPGPGAATHLYYRHPGGTRKRARPCPFPKAPWVRADRIEPEVIGRLVSLCGNPAAIDRAIASAMPDTSAEQERKARLDADLAALTAKRGRLIDAIADGVLGRAEARDKLESLAVAEAAARQELARIDDVLAAAAGGRPAVEEGDGFTIRRGGLHWAIDFAPPDVAAMTWADRRAVVEEAFAGPLPDGTPAGVYVSLEADGSYTFRIRGHIDREGSLTGGGGAVAQDGRPSTTPPHYSAVPFLLGGTLPSRLAGSVIHPYTDTTAGPAAATASPA